MMTSVSIAGAWRRTLFFLFLFSSLFFYAPRSLFSAESNPLEKEFSEAAALYQKGQDKEAETLFLKIIKQDPTSIRPRQFLGLIYARTKREEQAVGLFQEIIKMSPQHWGGYYGLGLVLKQVGALDQAKDALKAAIGLSGKENPLLWLNFAEIAEAQKKMNEAVPAYQKVIESAQKDSKEMFQALTRLNEIGHDIATAEKAQDLLIKAGAYIQAEDPKNAVPLYKEASDLLPKGKEIRYLLGSIASLAGNHDISEQALLEAVTIDPAYIPAHYALGRLYELTGRTVEAINTYETILNLSRDETIQEIRPSKEALFTLLDQQEVGEKTKEAHRLVSVGEWREAERTFQEAILIQPEKAVLHYNLANFYHQSGQNKRAEDVIEEALLIEPDSRALRILLAGVYREQRYFLKSIAAYVKVMSLLHEEPESLLHLTAFSGLIQSAVLLQKATAEAKLPYLEGLRQQSKEPGLSLSFFLKASALLPESPVLAYSIGTVYTQMGENRQAFLQFKRAIQGDSGFYTAHLALARVAIKEQRYLSAISAYQRLLRLDEAQLVELKLSTETLEKEFLEAIQAWQRTREGTRSLFQEAVTATDKGEAGKVIRLLLTAKKEEPENTALLFSLGVTHAAMGNWLEAERTFYEVLEIDPFYPGARFRLGAVQEAGEQLTKAKRTYGRILQLRDGSSQRKENALEQPEVQERFDKLSALIQQRQIATRHAKRGVLMFTNPDATKETFEIALWNFEQAVKLYPAATQYLYNLGLVQERLIFGKEGLSEEIARKIWDDPHFLDKPIQTYEESIRQNPNFPPIYIQLARLYGALGEKEKAIFVYKKGLDIGFDPELEDVKKIQQGLDVLEKRFSGSMSFISRQDSNFALTIPARTDFSNILAIDLSYVLFRKRAFEIPVSYFQNTTPFYRSQIFFSNHGVSLGIQQELSYALSYKLDARYNVSISEGSGLSTLQTRGSGSLTYRRRIPTSSSLTYHYSDMVFDGNKNLNRTGQQIELSFAHTLSFTDSLSFSYAFISQDVPKARDNTYQGHNINLQAQRRLPNNTFLRISGELGQDNFLHTDTVGNKKRRNLMYSYGAGLTVPWSPSISLTFDYLFRKNKSNLGPTPISDQDIVQGRTSALGDYQKRVWTVGVNVVF